MTDLNLAKYNQHWTEEFRYPYEKTRNKFQELVRNLSNKQIIELAGLRRTGKTILFFQLINHLLAAGQNRFSIWYFTFDEGILELDALLESFIKQTSVDFKKEKVYIVLDEIQKLKNFQAKIKVYYDLYPNIKFFISGSTSLFVRKKKQESLAGRIISLFLTPLSFGEYLNFKEKTELTARPLVFEKEIETEFEIYLKSQFVDSLLLNPEDNKKYLEAIVRKIVFEDIPQVFPVDSPDVLWKIVRIIAQNPGIIINLQSLCQEIDISSKTLSNYLFYLEEAFLIKKLYNFSKNLITSEKRLKKYYLAAASFSWALNDFPQIGSLVENVLISLNDYHFFWRDTYGHEVDFIEVQKEKVFPIEVKYRNSLSVKDLHNLALFSKKFTAETPVLMGKVVNNKVVIAEEREMQIRSIFFAT